MSDIESPREIPIQATRWNWGAFLLSWIWGIRHGVWSAFLVFIPIFGIFWIFILGAKGSQWAWENGTWPDPETFWAQQHRWNIAGVIILFASILLGVLFAMLSMQFLSDSDAYKLSYQKVQSDAYIVKTLGKPIKRDGSVIGNIHVEYGGVGQAELEYTIKGPNGEAHVNVSAVKESGRWVLQYLSVKFKNTGETRNLIPSVTFE